MSTNFIKRRLLTLGLIVLVASAAFPVFAYLSLHDVSELTFDGHCRQIVTQSLYRSDAAQQNLVYVGFPALAEGENVFDLKAERAKAPAPGRGSTYEDAAGSLRVDILQYRSQARDPFPICYPGPEPERVWTGVSGTVKLKFHRGAAPQDAAGKAAGNSVAAAENPWSPERRAYHNPLEIGWVSGRIENLEVRLDVDGRTMKLKDIEIPPTRMMAGPFGG